MLVVVAAGAYLETNSRIESRIRLHQSVSAVAATTASRLRREIETNLNAIRLVSISMETRPKDEIEAFRHAAKQTLQKYNALSQLTLVKPNGEQISMTRNNGATVAIPGISKFMLFKTMLAGTINTTEPLFSYQITGSEGRAGFFARYPSFRSIDEATVQDGYLFGFIDREVLFRQANFTDSINDISYALQAQTSYSTFNKSFYGDSDLWKSDAVVTTIDLPSGKWAMSAAPTAGWGVDPDNMWVLRLSMLFAGLIVAVFLCYFGRLHREKQRKEAELRQRETELELARRRLLLALDASKTGIFEIVPAAGSYYWDSRMLALHGAAEGSTESAQSLWKRITHPADLELFSQAVQSTLMTGNAFNAQYSIRLDDGQQRFMRAIGALELKNDGLVAIAGICRDVTDDVLLAQELENAKDQADAKNNDLQAALEQISLREKELDTTTRRLEMALDAHACGVFEINLDGEGIYWDHRMYALIGIESADGMMTHEQTLSTLHPDDRAQLLETNFSDWDVGTKSRRVLRVMRKDGSIRHVRTVSCVSVSPEGKRSLCGVCIDVTDDVILRDKLVEAKQTAETRNAELQTAIQELTESRREQMETANRLNVALTTFECGVWEARPGQGSVWDMRMHSLFGIPYVDGFVSYESWLGCLHPDDREKAMQDYAIDNWSEGTRVLERRIMLNDGSIRYLRSHGTTMVDRDGNFVATGVSYDITNDILTTEQLKQALHNAEQRAEEIAVVKDRILYNARHDSLTGLANRRYLDEELERLSKKRRGPSGQIAILHLDLDRFKQINDTMGHATGDAMLIHAAQILKQKCRETDLVARIGGDEFVILVSGKNSEADLARLASRVIEQMRQPIIHQGHECRFGVSIGIAQEGMSGDDAHQLLVNADIALYRAKEKGRGRYEFFSKDLAAEIINTKRTADEIMNGLENNEFVPWYQPQFDCKTLELCGLEALVRWNHPTKGVLTPDKFMKTAEELNVVSALDRIVLEKSLADRMVWAAQGLVIPKISVNVSARRIQDEGLIDSLKGLHIVPGQVSFELIESIFLDDSDTLVTANIERIKSLGIDIEIDDFGTGHTSIVSLLKLKPKRLKIDRQLVSPIMDSHQERSMVKSIIEIGRSLNIETVAEGVETLENGEMLKFLGCTYLQGFALGRPMPASKIVEFSHAKPWRKSA